MSTSSPSQTAAIRTYAADLEFMRSGNNSQGPTKPRQPKTVSAAVTSLAEKGVAMTTSLPTAEQKNTALKTSASTSGVMTLGAGITAADVAKEVLPAVIITDTKHKRFKLSQAVITSVSSWWGNKKKTALKKKVPRYTVPEAERRKGVIQKATSKTGVTSVSDHAAVVARIKAAKQIPHTRNTPAKAAEISPAATITPVNNYGAKKLSASDTKTDVVHARESSWDSDIQSQVNGLVTGPKTVPAKIILTGHEFSKIKKQRQALQEKNIPGAHKKILPRLPQLTEEYSQPFNSAHTLKPTAGTAVVIEPTLATSTPINRLEIASLVPSPAEISAARTTADEASTIDVVEQPNIFQNTETDANLSQRPTPVAERRFAPPRENRRSLLATLTQTNHLTFMALGAILFVIVTGLSLRGYLQNDPVITAPVVTPIIPTFTNATVDSTPFFVTDKNTLFEKMKASNLNEGSLVEMNFINPASGNNINASDFFTLLETEVVFDFQSAITKVTFGNYRGEPWILLTTNDKNTAWGGMLSWEKSLSAALSPLFGEKTVNSNFTDAIVGKTDVRVLKDLSDSEQIIYGFVDGNKVLITSNTTAFINLASSLGTF